MLWSGYYFPSVLQLPQSLFLAFGDHFKDINYNFYHYHLHIQQLLQLSSKIQVFVNLCVFFSLWGLLEQQNLQGDKFFFFSIKTRYSFLAEIGWTLCISNCQRTLCISFSRTDSSLCIYYLSQCWNFCFLHCFQWITFLYVVMPRLAFLLCYFAAFNY